MRSYGRPGGTRRSGEIVWVGGRSMRRGVGSQSPRLACMCCSRAMSRTATNAGWPGAGPGKTDRAVVAQFPSRRVRRCLRVVENQHLLRAVRGVDAVDRARADRAAGVARRVMPFFFFKQKTAYEI